MEMVAKHKNGLDAQAACRAVLTKLDGPGAHGDGWTQGQTQTRASRHGVMAEAGKLGKASPCRTGGCSTTGRQVKLAGLWCGSIRS